MCIKSSVKREQTCFALAFLKVAVIEYNVCVAWSLWEKVYFRMRVNNFRQKKWGEPEQLVSIKQEKVCASPFFFSHQFILKRKGCIPGLLILSKEPLNTWKWKKQKKNFWFMCFISFSLVLIFNDEVSVIPFLQLSSVEIIVMSEKISLFRQLVLWKVVIPNKF